MLFIYFSVIRLILWKKFVKKIWKPPKQKLTKILRDEISRKNFGTEFTFIRSHYQNFNTGRYSIWRKVILSKNFYGFCNLNDFRINNIPLTDVDYFVFSDAASFVRQGLSPYLRSVHSILEIRFSNERVMFEIQLKRQHTLLTYWFSRLIFQQNPSKPIVISFCE